MDFQQFGVHIPEWVIVVAAACGVMLSSFFSARKTAKATTQATQDQTTRIIEAFSRSEQEAREMRMMIVDNLKGEIGRLQTTITELQHDNAEFKALVAAQAEQIAKSQKEIVDLRAALNTATERINHQNQQANILTADFASSKAAYEQRIKRDDEDLSAKQREIDRLTAALSEATDKVKKTTDRLTALEGEVDGLKKRVHELELSLDKAHSDLNRALAERDELQTKLNIVQAERDAAKALVDRHTAQIAALTEQLDTLRAQLATMQGSEQVKG